MSDDVDRAQQLQDEANNLAIATHRRPVPRLERNGECHACGEAVALNALFCGPECAEEFERLERQKGRR